MVCTVARGPRSGYDKVHRPKQKAQGIDFLTLPDGGQYINATPINTYIYICNSRHLPIGVRGEYSPIFACGWGVGVRGGWG